MCFGGGSKQYSAYSSKKGKPSDFQKFRDVFDPWAKQDMARADAGTNFSKLNDYSSMQKQMDNLSRDGQAGMEIREMLRQHAIGLGKVSIDKRFTKFDPGYYKGYRDDYRGYYDPQVKKQFNETGDKLTATLADRGMLESSVGNSANTKLRSEYGDAKQNIANEALDASNKLRSQVEQSKSNLYSINEASADPMGVNAQAVGASTALVAPPQYSPLGQIFASALQPFANYAQSAGTSPSRQYNSQFNFAGGTGSGRVVR